MTWNLNSLRTRLPALERFLDRIDPDIVCLQETKVVELPDAAIDAFERRSFRVAHVGSGAYNGVAILSRHPIGQIEASGKLSDEHLDREPRVVSCVVDVTPPVRAVSVYVPHGRTIGHWHYEYKLSFFAALSKQIYRWLADEPHLVVGGDINVAATNSDVFHPDAFVGATHVSEPERAALTGLLAAGLVDVDVAKWGPRARRFTWWNYGIGYSRNLGMRIDILAADRQLAKRLDTTWIDHTERAAPTPSDHAALIADFHLSPS